MMEAAMESTVDDDLAATKPVDIGQRRNVFQIAMVMAGYCITTSDLFTGAAIATGIPLMHAIIAVMIGNTMLAIYAGLIGAAGAKHGVSTTLLARHAFGRGGAKVISIICAATLLGWYAVQTGLFGEMIHTSIPSMGFLSLPHVAALWGGILMMQTAYLGYRGLVLLSQIAIPALIILAIWGIVDTVNTVGGWDTLFAAQPTKPFSFTDAIVLTVGSFAVGAIVQADVTRYARSVKDSWIICILANVIANSFMLLAGIITALATGSGDLPEVMVAAGLSIPALIILVAAQWTTNDNNLYSASLALTSLIKVKKSTIVIYGGIGASILGAVGIAVGIVDLFIPWLMVLGILIPPIAGILIADYYIIHKGEYQFGEGTKYSQVVWPAFAAWAVGIGVGVFVPIGISSINAIVVAFVVHIVLFRICRRYNVPTQVGVAIEDREGF